MSHRGRGGRNYGGRRGGPSNVARHEDRPGGHTSNPERERPPPGLRGREIGMWFARRSRARREADGGDFRRVELVPRVHLEPQLWQKVEGALIRVEELSKRRAPSGCHDRQKRNESTFDRGRLGEVISRAPTVKKPARPNPALQDIRRKLPVFARRRDILGAINENQVCVISGETGSGKSTQVPQYIIEQFEERLERGQRHDIHEPRGNDSTGVKDKHRPGCFVVCTQPRRISAISVAERVAEERGETVGDRSVGYQIRLESRAAPVTLDHPVILYCTTGIVLQYLQSDPLLSSVSHLIIDEVHERSLHSDLLLAIVREKILPLRSDFRLICMSATLDSDSFVEYFGPACVHLGVSGRLYPVEDIYLEDYVMNIEYNPSSRTFVGGGKQAQANAERRNKLIDYGYSHDQALAILDTTSSKAMRTDPEFVVAAVKWICKRAYDENTNTDNPADGAILVFLPGWDVISDVCAALEHANSPYLNSRNSLILPLHSMLATSDQRKVFPRPPRGVRKIIVSTMIAEASVTIEDVVYVVDCGKTKLTTIEVDKNNQSRFGERWISKANAKQRMGRAGRVRPGKCFKLYTRMDYDDMDEFQQPEMARTRLEDVVLYIKELKLGSPEDFLPKCITPPDRDAVVNSVRFLEQLGALEPDGGGTITLLGKRLCTLSVEPRLGKLLLFACLFGDECLQPALSMAACLEFKDPFFTPMGKSALVDDSRRNFARMSGEVVDCSDHVMLATAVRASRHKSHGYLENNFLSSQTLKMVCVIREQFQRQLSQLGILPPSGSRGPGQTSIGQGTLRAVVCAGLYPGVGRANFKLPRELRSHTNRAVPCNDLMMKCLSTDTARRAQFHPKSVLGRQRHGMPSALFAHYLAQFSDSAGCVMLHEATPVDHFPFLLFASASDCVYDFDRESFKVGGWLELSCEPGLADLIMRLRSALKFVFDAYLVSGSTSSGASGRNRDEMSRYRDLLDALVFVFENTRSAEMFTKYTAPGANDGANASDDDDDDGDRIG